MKFSDILELHPANDRNFKALVEAVKRNTVVPLIGAGMSVPFYPLWNKALDKLKEEVDPKQRPAVERKMEAAANEIERCDVLEKALGKPALCRALCGLFDIRNFTEATDKPLNIRPAALLPRIFPNSPMLTVNLEKMAEEVFRRFSVPFLDSLGPQDTKRLAAWKQQRMHGILYLHGRVSGKLTDYDKLVFSKSQYNRHYRPFSRLVRALRGCMKDEQLLFLGCSLRHDRTLDILNKVYRAANKRLEHFAILDLKDEDADIDSRIKQLENDYGIRAIVYPNGEHKAVIAILAELLRRIDEVAYREYLNSLPVEAVNAKENDVKRFTPEAKNTDFCGKSAIEALEKLKAFCSDDRDFSWWAITAPGGSGKTRMMMELAEYEKTQGWSVRTLRQSEYDDEETLREIRRNTQPLLVISDYAGDHAKTLASWIELLSDHRGQKIRLLLAERSRGPE